MLSTLSIFWFLAITAFSWLVGFPLRRGLASYRVLDRPRNYSSHDHPVPRGGGLLLVAAFFAWYFLSPHDAMPGIDWLAAGVAAVAVVSFLDDVRHRSRRLRFVVYTIAAGIFVAQILKQPSVAEWGPTWLIAFLLWLWVAGYANAFNFIDGINGLAATQAIVALGFGAALCEFTPQPPAVGLDPEITLCRFFPGVSETVANLILLQLILAGTMTGFLGHNVPRARLFLGDVGSIATGFLMAAIAVIAGVELGWRTGIAMAALHLGPVLDTGITLIRRFAKGEKVYDRHREFFFHRAVRSGRSHLFVTGMEMVIQSMAGILLLAFLSQWSESAKTLFAVVAVIIFAWLMFFAWCEWQFQRRKVNHGN